MLLYYHLCLNNDFILFYSCFVVIFVCFQHDFILTHTEEWWSTTLILSYLMTSIGFPINKKTIHFVEDHERFPTSVQFIWFMTHGLPEYFFLDICLL